MPGRVCVCVNVCAPVIILILNEQFRSPYLKGRHSGLIVLWLLKYSVPIEAKLSSNSYCLVFLYLKLGTPYKYSVLYNDTSLKRET